MARERKRAGGLALVQARQSRLTAARERQRAAKSRRGFELTSNRSRGGRGGARRAASEPHTLIRSRLFPPETRFEDQTGILRLAIIRSAVQFDGSTRWREALSSGYPRISGSRGAILLHRRTNRHAPIGTGNGGGHTARFGLARGRSLRRRGCSLALPMPART